MNKKHHINLESEQKKELLDIVTKGKASARIIRRAHTVLMASEGQSDEMIAKTLHISIPTVERTRKQFCLDSKSVNLVDRPRSGKPPKITSTAEAYLIATTCSDAPEGFVRWTLKMLADKLVSLEIIDSVSTNTIGRTLKKTS
jgi:transposase